MNKQPTADARLAHVLAYAKSRWCWDDVAMLEELYQRADIDDTPEELVDAWARHYDLTDPRDVGL